MAISAITHDDPRCTVACAAYNIAGQTFLADDAAGFVLDSLSQAVARRR